MRRKVVVIGGGSAGIFTAYQFAKRNSNFDVTVLECLSRCGGHTLGRTLEYGGESMHVDCGAQFFYENNEPSYCDMLEEEGFFADGEVLHEAVGMTVRDAGRELSIFHIPSDIGSLFWAALWHSRDFRRLRRFTTCAENLFAIGDWTIPFGAWLDGLDLGGPAADQHEFKSNIVRPLMYQFGLVRPDQIDSLSALFVIYYYVTSVPRPGDRRRDGVRYAGPKELFKIYCLRKGMDGVLEKLVSKYQLCVEVGVSVTGIESRGEVWRVHAKNKMYWDADEVVFATNPMRTREILDTEPGSQDLRATLDQMPYVFVPVQVQAGTPSYMPNRRLPWELSNVGFRRDSTGRMTDFMLSIWFGPVRDEPVGDAFFKSWGSPELRPPNESVRATQVHELMVGTPGFIAARIRLRFDLQGRRHLWFVGGYIRDYDSQHASLVAAQEVVTQIEHIYSANKDLPLPYLPELYKIRPRFEPSPLFLSL